MDLANYKYVSTYLNEMYLYDNTKHEQQFQVNKILKVDET